MAVMNLSKDGLAALLGPRNGSGRTSPDGYDLSMLFWVSRRSCLLLMAGQALSCSVRAKGGIWVSSIEALV
jgi:hypothetical protein